MNKRTRAFETIGMVRPGVPHIILLGTFEEMDKELMIQQVAANLTTFFQAVYDYSRTIISDYVPQPHDWIYGSSYRPISASWARIPEAHYIQVDHRANNGVYTWVVVPYCLDEWTLAAYELNLLQEPK